MTEDAGVPTAVAPIETPPEETQEHVSPRRTPRRSRVTGPAVARQRHTRQRHNGWQRHQRVRALHHWHRLWHHLRVAPTPHMPRLQHALFRAPVMFLVAFAAAVSRFLAPRTILPPTLRRLQRIRRPRIRRPRIRRPHVNARDPRQALVGLTIALLLCVLCTIPGTQGIPGKQSTHNRTVPNSLPFPVLSHAANLRATASPQIPLTQLVNPFVGTDAEGQNWGINAASGNTFPGATLPFGMVQFSPDTMGGEMRPDGYGYTDSTIRGFSLNHLSGVGCPIFGEVPFLPTTGSVSDAFNTGARFSHQGEVASPGFYHARLDSGINVDLTATLRTGLARVFFPAGQTGTIALETGRDLRGVKAAHARVVNPTEVVGSVSGGPFCYYRNTTYTVYFDAQFSIPATSYGSWQGGTHEGASTADGSGSGIYLRFPASSSGDQMLEMKVGLSYVSVDNARANLGIENHSFDFDRVRGAADASWNEMLNRVQATGGSNQDERLFYTALYHALLAPTTFSDVNGQYPGFDGHTHTAQGYTQYANFSGWDIYRSEVPLLALVAPNQTSDMMQSLVSEGQQGGALPRWPLANSETGIMIGDSAPAILAEAEAFGANRFDTQEALRLAVANATQPGLEAGGSLARPGLGAYLRVSYIPPGSGAWVPVSATLEYNSDDYAIARLAHDLGDQSTARAFAARAAHWSDLFNTATGYPQERNWDGSFGPFDPTNTDLYVEGDAYQYTWMVPFDAGRVVRLLGGNDAAQRRLDDFFRQLNAGPASPYAFMGNEPSFGAPYMYDFAGAPAKTAATLRRVMTQLYSDSPHGLPGNDDLGEMSSWYVFAALGFYPLEPGRPGFVLGSPLFPHVALTLGSGRETHVVHLDAAAAGQNAPYIQRMTLDGRPSSSLWLPLDTLLTTTTIDFTMSGTFQQQWGTASGDVPPSLSTDTWQK